MRKSGLLMLLLVGLLVAIPAIAVDQGSANEQFKLTLETKIESLMRWYVEVPEFRILAPPSINAGEMIPATAYNNGEILAEATRTVLIMIRVLLIGTVLALAVLFAIALREVSGFGRGSEREASALA